jgi:hypothetical protein
MFEIVIALYFLIFVFSLKLFFIFFNFFNILISKINFFKIKNIYYFDIFLNKKILQKTLFTIYLGNV